MVLRFDEHWSDISERFRNLFEGLGVVTVTEDLLSFRSIPPDVATGIAITRSGGLVAKMPLHAVESRFTTVTYSSSPPSLTLDGDGMSYTYVVPPALLKQRKDG